MMEKFWRRATTPVTYIVLLVVWELSVRTFGVPSWILPAPTLIVATARSWAPDLIYNSYITIEETLIGFLLALVLSLPLAIMIAFTVVLRQLIYPILLALQSIPKVALAPLVILWLGVGTAPKVVVVILVSFFPSW